MSRDTPSSPPGGPGPGHGEHDAPPEAGRDARQDNPGQWAEATQAAKALPFGKPGRPFGTTPFAFGFTAALGVLTAWLLVQALTVTASMLLLIVVSLFLAVGLDPAVRWSQHQGLPRWAAISDGRCSAGCSASPGSWSARSSPP
ncbi:AI-2E family transporter [Nonomuraea insulae]|uniref:AI-2E family transporter n=1 Tax=Nonomuraea insulae TaxID=1616787 RepID=A0ABW1CAB3_9ACTN